MKIAILAVSISLVFTSSVMAIEPPEGVSIPHEGEEIAYNGDQFTEVLEAYGLSLTIESAKNLPPCFGVVKENTT